MKALKNIFTLAFLLGTLASCEKVIDVELEDSTPKIVIEAVLQEGESDFVVSISKTAPYFDNQSPKVIDDAIVLLSDDKNNTYEIHNIGNGKYKKSMKASTNTEYQLQVKIDGTAYLATSYLPEKVAIDSVYDVYEEGFGPRESGYTVYLQYSDPANVPNYYRVTHDLNGEYQNNAEDLQVLNDNNNDGNQARIPLFMQTFQKGDAVNLSLIHFDESSYDYFSSLGDIIGGNMGPNSGSAAPGNPISNWSNNALGYFSTYSADTVSLVVGE